ncbi:MAG: hypothetical protein Q9184_003599 [Pyrenodesmia sp. 2 TL-2023]
MAFGVLKPETVMKNSLNIANTLPGTHPKQNLHKPSPFTAEGQYPTFDIDLRLPGETCGCGCDAPDDLSKEISEVERLWEAVRHHKFCVAFLKESLQCRTEFAASQVHKDGEWDNETVLHFWRTTVGGLASKAESWGFELNRLGVEISDWLQEVAELDDSEESDGSESWFPTFDIVRRCNNLKTLKYRFRTMYDHREKIDLLRETMCSQANGILALDHATIPPGEGELRSQYRATILGLRVKAWAWIIELGQLWNEVSNRILDISDDEDLY